MGCHRDDLAQFRQEYWVVGSNGNIMPSSVTEPFGWFFLALADAATVDHDVIPVSRSAMLIEPNENASKRMCTSQF
jgi:hypothetical protein